MTTRIPALQPYDRHNQRLEANVHPPSWKNPVAKRPYHLVVIGAGTAGLVTAAAAAGLGARVALIERELMGGDCLNVGCVPSKGIISAARAAAAIRDAARFGIETGASMVDFGRLMERMRELRARISPHDSVERFAGLGVDVYLGEGRFLDGSTIGVARGDELYELPFRKAVVATGARASAPAISGLGTVDYLTNETLFSLTELPRRFGVIGSGPIGCEMAQAFARFGSDVFLFERANRILMREDPDASAILLAQLARDGVQVHFNSQEMQISSADGGGVRVRACTSGSPIEVTVDKLLVAAGRAPNTEGLNLQEVGVTYDQHGVQVNDYLQTTNPRIYAAGDICSRFKFTHAADFQARIVIQNALFAPGPFGRKKASRLVIPWATYTSPEIAHVGMHESDADRAGIEIETFIQHFSEVDRAILDGEVEGFVKVHVRKGTDKIMGATIVATNAGDMISEITLAITHGLGLSQIGSTIHPYPTQAEAIRKLGDQFNRKRLTPFAQMILGVLRKLNVGG